MRKAKYLIVYIFILSNIQNIKSQEICGIGLEFRSCAVENYLVDTTCSDLSVRHFISLKFYNICKTKGTDCLDQKQVLIGIQTLNRYFNKAGIYFETDPNSTFLNSDSIFNDISSTQLMSP